MSGVKRRMLKASVALSRARNFYVFIAMMPFGLFVAFLAISDAFDFHISLTLARIVGLCVALVYVTLLSIVMVLTRH